MSWEQLNSIIKSIDEEQAQLRAQPPIDCPNDGTPLQNGPDGILYCPFDGWRYN